MSARYVRLEVCGFLQRWFIDGLQLIHSKWRDDIKRSSGSLPLHRISVEIDVLYPGALEILITNLDRFEESPPFFRALTENEYDRADCERRTKNAFVVATVRGRDYGNIPRITELLRSFHAEWIWIMKMPVTEQSHRQRFDDLAQIISSGVGLCISLDVTALHTMLHSGFFSKTSVQGAKSLELTMRAVSKANFVDGDNAAQTASDTHIRDVMSMSVVDLCCLMCRQVFFAVPNCQRLKLDLRVKDEEGPWRTIGANLVALFRVIIKEFTAATDLDGLPSTISFPYVDWVTMPLFDDLEPKHRNSFVNVVATLSFSTVRDDRWYDVYYFKNEHTGEWLTFIHAKPTPDLYYDDDEAQDFIFVRGRVEPSSILTV